MKKTHCKSIAGMLSLSQLNVKLLLNERQMGCVGGASHFFFFSHELTNFTNLGTVVLRTCFF